VLDIYKPKFQKVSYDITKMEEELDLLTEEYKYCKENMTKSEEFDEFLERNEKTLNIQTKKFIDLKASLMRMILEFLDPFELAIRSLFFLKTLLECGKDVSTNMELYNNYTSMMKTNIEKKFEESIDSKIIVNRKRKYSAILMKKVRKEI
jgi:hypothetical protein